MQLPTPIRTYFAAQAPQDGDALAAVFVPDAIVQDEGHSHRGHQEIRDWWLAAKAKYRHEAKPIDAAEMGDKTVVRAQVSGDFAGSPAVLTFTFGLAGERITALQIG